jgi:hypothetical protein
MDLIKEKVSVAENINEITPAMLKEKIEEKYEQKLQEFKLQALFYKQEKWAKFSLKYPLTWKVEEWKNGEGVIITNPENKEYIKIFKQVMGHAVLNKEEIVFAGKKALKFKENYKGEVPSDEFVVIEVPQSDDIIFEINSNAQDFEKIISSFSFIE